MTIEVQLDDATLKRLSEEIRRKYVWPDMPTARATPQPLREVTVYGKRFVVLRDEHGEYYQPVSDAPAPRAEGQAQA